MLLLLLPNVLFLIVAVASVRLANMLVPDRNLAQRSIETLQQKDKSGGIVPTAERLLGLLRDSRVGRDELQADLSRWLLIAGCSLVFGVSLQVYLVLRMGRRRSNNVLEATPG